MPEGLLVIYVSEDDGETWAPLKPEDVPAWVKAPDVLGRLVAGEIAKREFVGGMAVRDDYRFPWYRAEKMSSDGETKQ